MTSSSSTELVMYNILIYGLADSGNTYVSQARFRPKH
jgi:hypothetical protein